MKATKQATPGTSGRSAPARGKFGKICLVLLLLTTAVLCGFAPRAWAEPVGCWTDVDAEGKPLYADISWYTDNPNDCNEYDLWDAADLAGLAYLVNNCKDYFVDFETGSPKIVRLRAPVDMSAHYWEPIGTFRTAVDDKGTIQDTTPGFVGIFDGGRYAISGIYVKRNENPAKNVYAGFFGSTAFNSNMPGVKRSLASSPMLISINIVDATIEGGLEEFSSKGSNNEITREPLAAGIVALAHGTAGTRIHDCTFSGSVNGYDAAGIVGQNNDGYVYTSVNMGAVSAVRYAGGIVARDFYRGDKGVTQCTNEGMITSDFAAGGITGIHGASTVSDWSPSQINNCASTGPVVGAKYSGAIAGYTVRSTGGDYSTCWYWLSEGSKATSSLGGHKSESFTAPKEAGEEDTLAGMPPTTVILDCADAPFGRMEGQKTDYSIDPARYVHPNNDGIYTLGPIAVYPTGSAAAENIVVSEYAVFKPDFTLSRTHLTREEYSEAYKACLTDYTGEDGYVRLRIYSEDDGRMEDTRAGAGTGTLLRYTEYNTDPRLLVEKIIDVPLITLSGATLKAGETAVLTASFDPDTTPQSARGLKWSSDNESVATVDASGKVTAVGVGQARITAVSEVFEETPAAECVVTVNKNDVQIEGVALDKTAIEITTGNTAQLSASVLPEGSPQGVTWSSSNAEVALVDEAGLVTAIAEGTAVVTATSSADSSKSASCTITVTASAPLPVVVTAGCVPQDGGSLEALTEQLPDGVTNVVPFVSQTTETNALDTLAAGGHTGTPNIEGIDRTEPGAVSALTTFSLDVQHDAAADGDLTMTINLSASINVAEDSSLYAFIPYRDDPKQFGSFLCTPKNGEITSVKFTVKSYARFFSEAPVILASVKDSAPQPSGGGGGGGCSAGFGALALLAVVPLFARRKK